MPKFKKLLVTFITIVALVFCASICAQAAQIDSLSLIDGTVYAQATAENARLYAVEIDEGLLIDAFFADIGEDGHVKLSIGEASEYMLYLWDRESLAPVSVSYILKDGVAYPEGSNTPVPGYEFPSDEGGYTFDQDDDVMIVSAISEAEITGFKAGVQTTYLLTEDLAIVGLSDKFEDVVPGSVVLIGTDKAGNCAAIELLASIGLPVNEEAFKADYGVYDPADGSTKYKNVVNVVFSKSGSKITVGTAQDKSTYPGESNSLKCYRVGLTMDGETPVISCTEKLLSGTGDASPVKSTSEYNNYVYLRIDTEQSKTVNNTTYNGLITQMIVYSIPKNYNFNPDPDDPWTKPFELNPIVIMD